MTEKSIRCFLDGIHWQHHLDADPDGTKLYPSEEDARAGNPCIASGGCGIVEVEVRFIRWVEPQNIKYENDVVHQSEGSPRTL